MVNTVTDNQTMKIVYDYFVDHYKDQRTAIGEYNKLKSILANYKSYRLISFGNIVFLLKIENNEVEFHSMGKETTAFAFVKDVHRLINYARESKFTSIRTYSDDDMFKQISDRMKLDIKQELKVGPDGKTYNYYRLEL